MHQSSTLSIGMEVHKESMAVADVTPQHGAEVPDLGTLGTRQCAIAQLTRKLPSQATYLVCVSEAGPWGDRLSRSLPKQGHDGGAVAPPRMPTKAGDRVTTARRDAAPLARLARSGDLTAVDGPTADDGARRALTRARAETLSARKDAKCRLKAFWLRHDIRSTGRAAWSPAPLRWRSEVVCPTPAHQRVFHEHARAVHEPTARLRRRAQERQGHAQAGRLPPVVEALRALRGVPCTVAVTLVADIGDRTRFDHPRALMTCLGLSPPAHASGERRPQGAMTHAGNTHARRALGEGAWACRAPAQVGRPLPRRLEPPPQLRQDLSGKAQVRLCQRDRRLMARGTHATGVTVAMARALGGFMGAVAHQVPVPAEVHSTDRH